MLNSQQKRGITVKQNLRLNLAGPVPHVWLFLHYLFCGLLPTTNFVLQKVPISAKIHDFSRGPAKLIQPNNIPYGATSK